jgi:hypothetical protein
MKHDMSPYKSSHAIQSFDDQTIRALFGCADAESEDDKSFSQLFVASGTFERFKELLPLRIVVGNKGTGKTAFIKKIHSEINHTQKYIPILIDPFILDEIGGPAPDDPIAATKHWRIVFARIAASRILSDKLPDSILQNAGQNFSSSQQFLNWILSFSSKRTSGVTDILLPKIIVRPDSSKIVFLVDDLDAGYDGTMKKLQYIYNFLLAARMVSTKESGIYFRIALRWDIYDLIERAGISRDFDKIRENSIFLTWSNHECFTIMAYRVSSFFGEPLPYNTFLTNDMDQDSLARYLYPVIDEKFYGRGAWANVPMRKVLLSLIRRRPRDLITLLSSAARNSNKARSLRINSEHLNGALPTYSSDRLSDIILEFKARLPRIELLLRSFTPSKKSSKTSDVYRYTNDKLVIHLKSFLQVTGSDFRFSFASHQPSINELKDILFRCEFLQAFTIEKDGFITRKSFDQIQKTSHEGRDFGFSWEVHPAYRWALQATTIDDVFQTID